MVGRGREGHVTEKGRFYGALQNGKDFQAEKGWAAWGVLRRNGKQASLARRKGIAGAEQERTGPDNGRTGSEKPERSLGWCGGWHGGTDSFWAKEEPPESWIEGWLVWRCCVPWSEAGSGKLVLARPPRMLLNWPGCQAADSKTRIPGSIDQNGPRGWAMRWERDLSPLTLQELFIPSQLFSWDP